MADYAHETSGLTSSRPKATRRKWLYIAIPVAAAAVILAAVLGGVLAWLVVAESGLHHGRPRRPNHSGVIGLLRLLLCKCRIGAISSLSPLTDIFVLQSTSVPIRVDNVPQTFRIRDIPEVFDLFPHMFNTADGLGDCMVWSGADWERTHADHVFMFRENVYG